MFGNYWALENRALRSQSGHAKIISMALRFTTSYLEDSLTLFRYYKNLAERAMAQVTDEELQAVLDDGQIF